MHNLYILKIYFIYNFAPTSLPVPQFFDLIFVKKWLLLLLSIFRFKKIPDGIIDNFGFNISI